MCCYYKRQSTRNGITIQSQAFCHSSTSYVWRCFAKVLQNSDGPSSAPAFDGLEFPFSLTNSCNLSIAFDTTCTVVPEKKGGRDMSNTLQYKGDFQAVSFQAVRPHKQPFLTTNTKTNTAKHTTLVCIHAADWGNRSLGLPLEYPLLL